jgi:hypothetical protein
MHAWKEKSRRTFSNPFWIRRESGERVRIEPGENVKLVDALDVTVQVEREERFRIAELSAGETVTSQGVLTSEVSRSTDGYREAAPRTWVLRPEANARLPLMAENPGDHHRRMSNVFIKRIAFTWVPFALIFATLSTPFFARMAFGESTSVVIDSKFHRVGDANNGPRWSVSCARPGGGSVHISLDEDEWASVSEGDRMAYFYVPKFRQLSAIGSGSTAYFFTWLGGLFAVMLCNSVMMFVVSENRAWYEGRKHYEGGRAGHLPEPTPTTRTVRSRES